MDGEGKLCFKDAEEFREILNITSSSKKPPKGSSGKPVRRDMFKKVYPIRRAGATTVKRSWRERQMYQAFINVVKDNELCPGYKFTSLADKGDKDDPTKQRVDVVMFKEVAPTNSATHWGDQALWIEFKRDGAADPFKGDRLAAKKLRRADTWAQLITFAARVFETQHRTHLYSILVCGRTAYIMRWDRSGVLVTKGFDYIANDELLADFLRSFARMTPTQQGYDTTAEPVELGSEDYVRMDNAVNECKNTFDCAKDYFRASLADGAPRWRVRVEGYAEPFLIGNPHFRSWGVFGRGTKVFVAYEAMKDKFFWLKDVWRIDLDSMEKEGKIITELHEVGEEDIIPTVICQGDVSHEINDERVAQSTLAQKYFKKAHEEARKERKAKTVETKRRQGRAAAGNKLSNRSSKRAHSVAKQSKGRNQANEASSTDGVTNTIDGPARSDEQEHVVGQPSINDGEENRAGTSRFARTSLEQQHTRSSSPHADEAINDENSTVKEAAQSPTTEQETAQPFMSKGGVVQRSSPAKGLIQPSATEHSSALEGGGVASQNLSNVASSSCQEQASAEDEDTDATPLGSKPSIMKYTHYRLVEKEVGKHLEEFRDGLHLLSAVGDALIAYSQAVTKARRVPLDVSPNNIVAVFLKTTRGGKIHVVVRGLLFDWEFSKLLEDDPALKKRRQIDRTGTWQFQSAMVLLPPAKSVEIADELESFFYVLLYCSLRYIHNTCSDLASYMPLLFDFAVFSNGDYWCPSHKDLIVTTGKLTFLATEVHFLSAGLERGAEVGLRNSHPLNDVLSILLHWFKARYTVSRAESKLAPPEYLIHAAEDRSGSLQTSARDGDEEKTRTSATQMAENQAVRENIGAKVMAMEREQARKLATHNAMLNLIANAIVKRKWPQKDRAGDQLPGHSHEKRILPKKTTSRAPAHDPDAIAMRPRQQKRTAHASVHEDSSDDTDERPAKRQRKTHAPRFTHASSSRGTKRGASDNDSSDGPLEPPGKRVRTSRTAAPVSQSCSAPAASGSRTSHSRPASKPSSRTRKADISTPPPPVPARSRGSANAPVASGSRSNRSRAAEDQSSTEKATDGVISGARRSMRLSAKDKGKARAY
ncbi:uncharacterized protein LAESUDRAFT_761542 [Laetiporus sulphureus 93-53]|uniref:Fungal-type protein kinase domain-containing protein n=1 Tax=Laetiporus sulphureus 93-53 TaxID=1314785 RepID=A0A165D1F6_9APHY|nr:uncharacterized protein LAESUDRAFT_761542 [Laetiporus sulphureus 93-53]KZT03954.1 hypothetical protein LAESUDRAFT_761542 [Laetiporus sulphureus 93-53]